MTHAHRLAHPFPRAHARMIALTIATAGAALALPLVAADAYGSGQPGAYVVTRDASAQPAAGPQVRHVSVDPQREFTAELVVRRVVEPAAVVPRELAEQPTFTHLAEVHMGIQNIYVDPKRDDLSKLHPDHDIRKAVRRFQTRPPGTAQVIWGSHAEGVRGEGPQPVVRPRAVIYRPDALGPAPQPGREDLPEVLDEAEPGQERKLPAPRQIRPAPKGESKLVMHGE